MSVLSLGKQINKIFIEFRYVIYQVFWEHVKSTFCLRSVLPKNIQIYPKIENHNRFQKFNSDKPSF